MSIWTFLICVALGYPQLSASTRTSTDAPQATTDTSTTLTAQVKPSNLAICTPLAPPTTTRSSQQSWHRGDGQPTNGRKSPSDSTPLHFVPRHHRRQNRTPLHLVAKLGLTRLRADSTVQPYTAPKTPPTPCKKGQKCPPKPTSEVPHSASNNGRRSSKSSGHWSGRPSSTEMPHQRWSSPKSAKSSRQTYFNHEQNNLCLQT